MMKKLFLGFVALFAFTFSGFGYEVKLAWDELTSEEIAEFNVDGFNVYVAEATGSNSGQYSFVKKVALGDLVNHGSTPEHQRNVGTSIDLESGKYNIYITVTSTGGGESGPSNIVEWKKVGNAKNLRVVTNINFSFNIEVDEEGNVTPKK